MGKKKLLPAFANLWLLLVIIIISVVVVIIISSTSNSNWTEWSTIQGVIAQVISKSDKRKEQGRFEITSSIIP